VACIGYGRDKASFTSHELNSRSLENSRQQACNRFRQLLRTYGESGRNIRVVFDSGPFALLCENMTSYTKPEVLLLHYLEKHGNTKIAYFTQMLYDCLGMRGIPVSEKYRGIKSDGIIYRGLAKYRPQLST